MRLSKHAWKGAVLVLAGLWIVSSGGCLAAAAAGAGAGFVAGHQKAQEGP